LSVIAFAQPAAAFPKKVVAFEFLFFISEAIHR
jgi:hypothetical protein